MGDGYQSLFKDIPKKKRRIAQSEALRQAPTKIKKLYNDHYIGNEKDFLELLLYIQENDNLAQVLDAVKQLESIHFSHVSTERITFICDQDPSEQDTIQEPDETMNQSEGNMMAYAKLFNQMEEGTL